MPVDDLDLNAADFKDPLVEAAATSTVVPAAGRALREDGTVRVAVIRPCVSRGKRVNLGDGRSLPPIYTPRMLEASAGVFTGWPMYIDHAIAEALAEALRDALGDDVPEDTVRKTVQRLQERRKLQELGGRVVRTWWDRDLSLKEDRENGYRQGAVVGDVVPYQWARGILEVDPLGLGVSINAWPTGAKVAEYDGTEGALIAGISPTPVGSVDWVWKGGAGGRPLTEAEQMAVTLAEALITAPAPSPPAPGYDPHRDMPEIKINTDGLTETQLIEKLREQAPSLAEKLVIKTEPAPKGDEGVAESIKGLSTKLDEMQQKLEEATDPETVQALVEERADQMRLTERLERRAHKLIEDADAIPESFKAELKQRYVYLPSGPSAGLIVEAETDNDGNETKSVEDVLEKRVSDDLDHVRGLLADAQGKPRVQNQGGKSGDDDDGEKAAASTALAEFLVESGDIESADKTEDWLKGATG